jgi:predicted nucleic acid-binding protein
LRYLLDTCVLSDLLGGKPSVSLVDWLESEDERDFHISVLTVGQLHGSVAGLASTRRRKRLHAWVDAELRDRFRGRILDVDMAVVRAWGGMGPETFSLPVTGGLIAATAAAHHLVVVSRDLPDLSESGVEVLDPF